MVFAPLATAYIYEYFKTYSNHAHMQSVGWHKETSIRTFKIIAGKLYRMHRGAFCQFPFRWIYYFGINESTGKETGKMHLCGMLVLFTIKSFRKVTKPPEAIVNTFF